MASALAEKFKKQRVVQFESFLREKNKGDTGASGPRGPQGLSGERGPIGPSGATGPKGDKGERGPQGPIGPQGPAGAPGEDGVAGEQGAPGPMPKHETRGDAIRFEQAPGVWGKWISLPNLTHQQSLSVGSITKDDVIVLIQQLAAGDTVDYNTLIDTVGDLKYIGRALPGTATSVASWSIKLIDLTNTEGDIDVLFANGTADFDKVWDDRATYTYTPTGS